MTTLHDRYLSDGYSLTQYLEEGNPLPARMRFIIGSYEIIGKKHFYARLEGYLGDEDSDNDRVLVTVELTRPTLLIERELDRFRGCECTNAFTTRDQAKNRAREFAVEFGIEVWVKEWFDTEDEKYGEYRDWRPVPL